MKVLILNGSPHKNGDTGYILEKIKEKMPQDTEVEEMILYNEDIKPCIDCRYCWKNEGCTIKDRMDIVWKDDYDVVIVASPVYMYNVTPPLFSLITRLNMKWCNKFFMGKEEDSKEKRGILVLVGGGIGAPTQAIDSAQIIFDILNAKFDIEKDYIYSLNTNNLPASQDENVDILIDKMLKDSWLKKRKELY